MPSLNGSSEDALLVALAAIAVAIFVVTVVFAGYTIHLRREHHRRDRRWQRLTERWRGPVLQALTDPATVEQVRGHVEEADRLHFVHFVLEYHRRVRGAERGTLRELVKPYLPLIVPRARHRRPEVRTRAIQTLGTLGLPEYADVVLRALDDASPLVSMVAARYLARQDHPEFAEPVLAHLQRYEGWNRRFLASMLASMGPDVSARLRTGLADTSLAPWIRAVLADALLMQLDPVAADVAAEALDSSDDRELVAASLRLLAALGRPGHVARVREYCESPDFVVRAQALLALGVLSQGGHLPYLEEALRDESPWVALQAARGLREAGGRAVLERLGEGSGRTADLAGQVLAEEAAP